VAGCNLKTLYFNRKGVITDIVWNVKPVPCKNSNREKPGKIVISFAISEFRLSGKLHNIQPMRQESEQRFAT
jgi:hypothetical protein